ncbi:DUF6507 family protein [Streptomyces sp. NPDC012510]|uniref:DUF6507 family protein n=1 Tax=Streptomyces sp. NPDC012510 TaxID=3364838 RepID=UPI0036E885AD
MTAWDISSSGVQFVTSLVEDAMDDLAKDVKAYGTDVASAAESAGTISAAYCGASQTGAVGAALALFVEGTAQEVLFLGARAAKSVSGAREATGYYEGGALEMAATAQRNALAAPKVEMPGKGGEGQGGGEK